MGTELDSSYLEHGSTFVDRLRTNLVCASILKRMPNRQGLRVLDLGCGFHAIYLKKIPPKLEEGVGIDVSVSQQNKDTSRLRFALGSLEEELPKQSANYFDVVLYISVLEHMWDPVASLEQCYRVLKPGGLLLVNVPTWYAKPVLELSAFKFGTSPASGMDDHKMYYGKRDLWPMLVKAGFLPSRIRMNYERAFMVLFATVTK